VHYPLSISSNQIEDKHEAGKGNGQVPPDRKIVYSARARATDRRIRYEETLRVFHYGVNTWGNERTANNLQIMHKKSTSCRVATFASWTYVALAANEREILRATKGVASQDDDLD
jgi:hypothetical protein